MWGDGFVFSPDDCKIKSDCRIKSTCDDITPCLTIDGEWIGQHRRAQ